MADNKENKVLNVPALRFPGFKNSWDCTILEKLSKKIGDGIHSTPSYDDDGTFYFINGNNLNRGKIVITSSTKRVSEKEAYKNNAENLEADSILMSINGTIGNVALYNNEPIMLGKSACYINSKDNVDKKFLFYYLQYPKTQSYFEAELTGTTIKNLSLQSIRKTKICIPTIEEQHKISHFLQKIDERIATQNKIIEKLETLIKGIRNNIISKIKGDCIVLQDIADIYQPQTIASTDLTEDGYLVYGANGIIGKYHSFNHEKEQICITCRGNTCGTVNFTEPKSWITGNAMVINTDNYAKNVNKRYLFHYLSSINFNSIISGSGQPQIVRQPLAKLKLILPVLIIQNRIAECLDAMFAKMKNEQSFLQILQIQKSCLLSQMFI